MHEEATMLKDYGSQPTYEELKPEKPRWAGCKRVGSQPTYEELKPSRRLARYLLPFSFPAYL